MNENQEKTEVKGFVKLIARQLLVLNDNPVFQRRFKDEHKTFLLNITDGEYAGIIRIDKGKVAVESVKNGDKKLMDRLYQEYNCDGMLETDLSTLYQMASGNLGIGSILKEIIKKKVRIKGVKKIRLLQDLFNFNMESHDITRETKLRDIIKKWAEVHGDKTFLTYIVDFDKGIDEKYSYKDMHLISNRLANGFLDMGIGKGDGIALMDINSPEFLFTVFAAVKIGAYVVLINTGLKGDGLKYILDHSEASSIVIHWSFLDKLSEVKEQLPRLRKIIVDNRDAPDDFVPPAGTEIIGNVMEASEANIETEISLDDMCMLMYTAGTTGLPKAIIFWQGRLLGGLSVKALMKQAYYLARPNDVVFTPLPLFHSNALFLSTFLSYICGLSLVLGKRFSASRHWDICRKYNVTTFNTLGAMVTFLMKQPEKPNDRDHVVRSVNTAACPKELWEGFEKRFGTKVVESYGATDGGGFMLQTIIFDDFPVGTMGKPMPGVVAEIMDDQGNIFQEPDKSGELVFLVRKSETKTREVKYFKDQEASRSLVQKGADGQLWFHSGDLAHKDKDGWFYFEDRKKDSIRRRGENIASVSIENIINQNDKIYEVAAYGVKTEIGEDEVMVSVVLKPGKSMTPEELVDFCHGKMADFMIPRYINFLDALPKNEVHRVLKRKLKEIGVTESTHDREKTK
ncbi:MAG: AMP-binding protein [Candidatus Hodarchaeota archaeon]